MKETGESGSTKNKTVILLLIILLTLLWFVGEILVSYHWMKVNRYPVQVRNLRYADTVTDAGFKMVVISDLHDHEFGKDNEKLIRCVKEQDPELIILDEPTAGQDFHHYTEIMEFLRGLNEQGVTVVMITHDMHLMLEYTPRALVFADGQLIADRSAAAVLCDPELIQKAALKETSLFTLANHLDITPAEAFVERFIKEDREVRSHGC